MSDASTTRVLVVDDEPSLLRVVCSYLEREGFDVVSATDGEGALALAREIEPDVVVLDLMLPGIDGIEVCRQLRTFSDAYVVMLTAKADEVDTLIGLAVGADDYVTKPFSPRELMARVHTVLRRPRRGPPLEARIRQVGELEIDLTSREVRRDGVVVSLTRTEFDLLDALSSPPRGVLSRRALMTSLFGPGWTGDEHAVDVHLNHVRHKLADDTAQPRFIVTVRGVGYRMGAG